MSKWGHDELQEDLAEHLSSNPSRMVWADMQLGPSGSPRPDVFTLEKSYSKFRPRIYEVKISRSDFRHDVTEGKWIKYLDFACCVTFAVPQGLIRKDEVPRGCGLIVRHNKVWRHLKKPTLQSVETLDHLAWMKLLIDGVSRERLANRRVVANEYRYMRAVRKKLGDEVADAVKDVSLAHHKAKRIVEMAEFRAEHIAERARKAASGLSDSQKELYWKIAELFPPKRTTVQDEPGVKDVQDAIEFLSRWMIHQKEEMNADGEVTRLRRVLNGIRNELEHAGEDPGKGFWWW